jgi:phosphate transport system substrate-binding protein
MTRPRALNTGELEQLAQQGFGDMRSPENEHVVGLDGIVVTVSPGNPVAKLSLQQLQGIFSGAIFDWSQVGGTAGKINVYARDSKSGTFDTFKTLVLDPGNQKLTDNARRLESSNELSDFVANDPSGIGFIGFAYVRNAKAVSLVNECGMTFAANTFDVKTEEYPLSRRLFLYSGKLHAGSFAAGLLDFAMSHSAQDIVRDSGFIDQELEVQPDRQLGRMAEVQSARTLKGGIRKPSITLVRDTQETSRLSATMRFRFNSVELDNKALNDVDILAQFLRFLRETKRERKLLLVGFTDSVGAVDKNMAFSLERANSVRQALLGRLRDPQYARLLEVRGYGPLFRLPAMKPSLVETRTVVLRCGSGSERAIRNLPSTSGPPGALAPDRPADAAGPRRCDRMRVPTSVFGPERCCRDGSIGKRSEQNRTRRRHRQSDAPAE